MSQNTENHDGWPVWIRYFFLIGLFFMITRTVLDSDFRQSSVLYVLVPYLVAVAIYVFVPAPSDETRWTRFSKGVFGALIVMLGTSAILFEGFLCVLAFIPIYFIIVFLTLLVMVVFPPKDDNHQKLKSSIFPLLIAVLSLEGVHQSMSFNREYSVTRNQIVDQSIAQIHDNLRTPIHLEEGRNGFLSLFPLPTRVEAGSFKLGDIHKAFFTYKRWGLEGFNAQNGETWVKLAEIRPHYIRTEIVKDTSYYSHYLTIHGTEIELNPVSKDATNVKLTIHYRRDLDPSWYFGPLQQMALIESADYLINHVIARTDNEDH